MKDDPVPMGEPPVAAVYQEIVAPACGGVADKVTVPASQRVTLESTPLLEVVVMLAGIAVMMVATTANLDGDRQFPTSPRASA